MLSCRGSVPDSKTCDFYVHRKIIYNYSKSSETYENNNLHVTYMRKSHTTISTRGIHSRSLSRHSTWV